MATIADRNVSRNSRSGEAADQKAAADRLTNAGLSSSHDALSSRRTSAPRSWLCEELEMPEVIRIKREPTRSFASSIAPGLSAGDIQTSLYLNTNRARSGWTTLELYREGSVAGGQSSALVGDPSELPPDNAALIGSIPVSTRASRLSNYELARTVAIPQEVLQQMRTTAELEAYGQAARSMPARGIQSRSSAVQTPDYELQSMKRGLRDRLETMAGLGLIIAGLITLGWFTAQAWPSDITPAVKAFTSSPAR